MNKDTPYAGGRWTEARYKSFIRSTLRQAFMKWPCKYDALESARRKSQTSNKRQKWEYQCAACRDWFMGREVEVDHIEPVGSLDDANKFIGRLFCEESALRVVCKGCHCVKTKKQYGESLADDEGL